MKKTLFLPLIGFLMFFPFVSFSQSDNRSDSTSRAFDFIKDDFIAAALDSLANLRYFEGYEYASEKELENVFGFSQGFVPVYSDSVYYLRIQKLDASTPINLTYNQYVRDYIELYAVKKRGLTQRVMGLAQIYFPMFEEQLDKFDMPLELKYLAIVESALNPEARSRVGATGLWQFMYGTGKMYDLNVTSFVDDRRDPIKSTVAACEHMSDLYKMYKDWLLVLAAYNSGAGNVNKAIRRSGGKMDFWQIRPFLPLETRGYVPAFIGVTYVMTYAAEHNLRPVAPRIKHYEIDTVNVKDFLTFSQIAENISVPMEELQFLNPSYKAGVIPAVKGTSYVLRLPKKYVPHFVNNEAQLYALNAEKKIQQEQLVTLMKTVTEAEYHKVKKGESLGLLAKKYRCTVTDLKKWNRLKSTQLAIGQRLIVRPEKTIEQQQFAEAKKPQQSQGTEAKKPQQHSTAGADKAQQQQLAEADKTQPQQLVETSKAQPQQIAEAKTPEQKPNADVKNSESAQTLAQNTAEPNTSNTENKPLVKYEDIHHTVKKGENLGSISKNNGVSINDIKKWNNLKGTAIQTGQKLIVGKKEIVEAPKEDLASKNTTVKKEKNKIIYYTVQRGDTLWTIAQKHAGTSVEDIMKLNNINNERSLKPGQKIKVAVVS